MDKFESLRYCTTWRLVLQKLWNWWTSG